MIAGKISCVFDCKCVIMNIEILFTRRNVMKEKKWIFKALSLGCIGCMAIGLTACGDEEGSSSSNSTPTPADVSYTLVLTDQDGNAVVGAELKLLQGETEIASGTTDSNGKITGTAKEGEYVVQYVGLPMDYLADDYTVEVTVSTSDAIVELSAINATPNGTLERPYTFIPDAAGYMEIAVPGGATHYYQVPRPMGRTLLVEGANFEVVYKDKTYAPQEGITEIAFESDASDTYALEVIAIVNKSTSENAITLGMPVPPGSSADNAIALTLGAETVAEVKGGNNVYYTWTATASGTLTISSSSTGANLYMYNENTYIATEWAAESVTIAVNANDKILIQVGVTGTPAATDVNEIAFTITLE